MDTSAGEAAPPGGHVPVEEQLRQLHEKTAAWKQAVAAQLSDAAKKNKALREDLQKAREGRESDLATLRVQMNREFKERTAMKEEEVKQLHEKLDALYAQQQKTAADHGQDMTRLEQRVREACLVEAAQEKQRAVDDVHAQMGSVQSQLDAKQSELDHQKDIVATLTTRLERLSNQYQELSSLLQKRSSGTATVSGDVGREGGASPTSASPLPADEAALTDGVVPSSRVHDAEHQRQLDDAQAAMQEREREVQRQLEAARREHELHMSNLVRELHRRDEHAVMLQTLQKQLQQDLMNAQLKAASVQEEKAALEKHLAGKVAALSKELADCLESQARVSRERDDATAQQHACLERIAELEGEAASREEAFRALMLSDEEKQLVSGLQRELQAARTEADTYKVQLDTLTAETARRRQSSTRRVTAGNVQGAEAAVGSDSEAEEATRLLSLRVDQLEEREQQMESERIALQQQREAQQVMEAKLEAMKRSLAAQANQLFSSGPVSGAGDVEADTPDKRGAGVWGTNHASREGTSAGKAHQRANNGGAGARRPPLAFDENAATAASTTRRTWAGTVGGGGILGWVPSRLRVLVPALLFFLVFFSVLNMKAVDTVAKKSADPAL